MTDMLTAKDVQDLLQVDRSTVYRMAEDGRLPAIKVGKQWRFPAEQMEGWLRTKMGSSAPYATLAAVPQSPARQPEPDERDLALASLLPLECVELIQDSHADLLGVMLVITDMGGQPITRPSRPCGLFALVNEEPDAIARCISSWHDLGQELNLEPTFHVSHLGLLCARGLIRVGAALQGMVIAGCIAPDTWPPTDLEVKRMAADFGVDRQQLQARLHDVYHLDDAEKRTVLTSVQRIANIIAHIVNERQELVGRLDKIAGLARLD